MSVQWQQHACTRRRALCVAMVQPQEAGNTNWVEVIGENLQVSSVSDALGNIYWADPGPGPDPIIIPDRTDYRYTDCWYRDEEGDVVVSEEEHVWAPERLWFVSRLIMGGHNVVTATVYSPGQVDIKVSEYRPG